MCAALYVTALLHCRVIAYLAGLHHCILTHITSKQWPDHRLCVLHCLSLLRCQVIAHLAGLHHSILQHNTSKQ
jgi:hypothetical protein